eukprot:scaffold101797_cov39-Tisochrysis_lutea.AAC.3
MKVRFLLAHLLPIPNRHHRIYGLFGHPRVGGNIPQSALRAWGLCMDERVASSEQLAKESVEAPILALRQ